MHRNNGHFHINPGQPVALIHEVSGAYVMWTDAGSAANCSITTGPGFSLPRHYWVLLNRFWTNQGHSAHRVERSGALQQPTCRCGKRHIINQSVNS